MELIKYKGWRSNKIIVIHMNIVIVAGVRFWLFWLRFFHFYYLWGYIWRFWFLFGKSKRFDVYIWLFFCRFCFFQFFGARNSSINIFFCHRHRFFLFLIFFLYHTGVEIFSFVHTMLVRVQLTMSLLLLVRLLLSWDFIYLRFWHEGTLSLFHPGHKCGFLIRIVLGETFEELSIDLLVKSRVCQGETLL